MSSATALSFIASGIFLIRLLPQPVRLARTGTTAGVSPIAAANAVTSAMAWLAYGLVEDLLVVWIVSVIALVPGVWSVWLLRHEFGRGDVVIAGAIAAVFVLAAAAGFIAVALGLGVVTTAGPQVWRSVRQSDLRGIAPMTWFVALADALSWGAYGVVLGDRALEGYAVVLLTSALIVLGRVAWTAKRYRDTPAIAVA